MNTCKNTYKDKELRDHSKRPNICITGSRREDRENRGVEITNKIIQEHFMRKTFGLSV